MVEVCTPITQWIRLQKAKLVLKFIHALIFGTLAKLSLVNCNVLLIMRSIKSNNLRAMQNIRMNITRHLHNDCGYRILEFGQNSLNIQIWDIYKFEAKKRLIVRVMNKILSRKLF